MAELHAGDTFAGHVIEGIAGRGGMGVVYRARDLDLDRVVALKLVAPALAEDASFRERFERETRVAASIDHPNVIPLFYAGDADGRLYIAMRYVEGDDLRTLVRREGRLEPQRAARIVAQVGSALDAAHARGIVHRDVKPANVLLGPGDHAYLTDFGLTKRIASTAAAQQTRPGGWVGTLGYVSPEQIRGHRVDARADVYALGCLLYFALTGAAPYGRDSDEATLWAHLNAPPPRVAEAPAPMDAVIDRALAKDPDDRFPSAGDLGRAALAAAGAGVATEPERLVAVGPAAPAGTPQAAAATAVTAPTAPRYGDETVASPPEQRTGATREDDRRRPSEPDPGRRRLLPLVAAAALLVLVGTGAVLLAGGGDDPAPSATTATTPTPTRAQPEVAGERVAVVAAGTRPNALVATKDRVFVVSGTSQRLTLISTASNRPVRRAPKVGVGAQSITAGFGAVWVVKGNTQSLLRYGLKSGARQGPAVPLPAGQAVAVDAAEGGVWVGSRSGARRAVPQTVAKVTPETGAVQTRIVPNGVQNLAVGDGAVWVVNRSRRALTRLDIRTGMQRTLRGLGRSPYAVAVGGGSVWVTNADDDTVTQFSSRAPFGKRRTIGVGRDPHGIGYGGGSVWVANQLDGTMTRIRAADGVAFRAPVRVGSNPFAVSVRGRSAWVTLLGDNAVARIDF